jgi:hypothetical protein
MHLPQSEHGQPRRLPILYWRSKAQTSYWESVVANPPGHTSTAGAHGTGSRKVTPDGSARLVSLIPKPTGRLRTVQDQGRQAGGEDDTAKLPPFPLQRGAVVVEPSRYNLRNLWRRLVLPARIGAWSLTTLQQRLVENRRTIDQERALWLLLAKSHLTRRLVWQHAEDDRDAAVAQRNRGPTERSRFR